MYNIFLVALGGACGSCFRYIMSEIITLSLKGQIFPVAIISVNIIGSFLAGILHFLAVNHMDIISPQSRLILMTGFLGGFTTLSAFSVDVFRLIHAGQLNTAASYIILSVALSIAAIFFGFYLAKIIIG